MKHNPPKGLLKFFGTKEGIELQLCFILQGYRGMLVVAYLSFTGSYYLAQRMIRKIEETYLRVEEE